MTPKELKRLSRSDLLEMLLDLSKENDQLRAENNILRRDLEEKNLAIQNSGSLAEAVLKLNGVFRAAQAACDQYTLNIQEKNARLEQQTAIKCETMLEEAKAQARDIVSRAEIEAEHRNETYSWISELMDNGEKK